MIPDHVEKSIGAETTFDVDVSDLSIIRRTMLALSNKVAQRLRQATRPAAPSRSRSGSPTSRR